MPESVRELEWRPEMWQALVAGRGPSISHLSLPPTDPDSKSLGGDVYFLDGGTQELGWEDKAGDNPALPYLGPVPWVGASCHKQHSLAGLWGLLCGPRRRAPSALPRPVQWPAWVISPQPLLNPPGP